MIPFLFSLTTWLVVTLPITSMVSLFSNTDIATILWVSIVAAVPYAGLMWHALQRPRPGLRKILMQGISVGYACAAGLLLSVPALLFTESSRATLALLLATAVLAFGVYSATAMRVRKLQFQSEKISKPMRLVQLTDVHLGSRSSSVLSKALSIAEAQQPDAIVITGDLVDGGEIGKTELAPLAHCDLPLYMVIGNHERYVNLEALLADINAQGVSVLHNTSVDLGDVRVLGADDNDAPDYLKTVLPGMPTRQNAYNVLLYHKPDNWAAAREAGVDLMLSGHTHAGQVWPFSMLVKRRHAEWQSLYSKGEQHLYVAPGTGCWGPVFRIGSRSEVTVIELTPA